ncbi:MAG: serine/threonine protein kinase [Polyangiaceae bacterium]|nr:serine/threonine protein kinase [Polyangiaceae bacterium]
MRSWRGVASTRWPNSIVALGPPDTIGIAYNPLRTLRHGTRASLDIRRAGPARHGMDDPTAPTCLQAQHNAEERDHLAEEPDDLLGTTLHETYKIIRVVGEGGMGRVYEAHHTRIEGKRFAIKALRVDMMHSPEVRARFQREAQAAASIHHSNVMGVHDYGHTPDGRPYLVAEFLEGIDLRLRVEREGELPVDLAVYIGRRVCDAIQTAHVHGVIHRDLKPENIFLIGPPDRPIVKVLDFGLSRFMESEPGSTVTRTGVVMGTPAYMAPEQARGERVDHRVDVYGVGVLLYVALTARAPFGEETPQQTVLAVLSKEPQRPCAYNPAIPEGLEVIIQRAMARDVAARYPSVADLDAALAAFDTLERPLGTRTQLLTLAGASSDESEVIPARTGLSLLIAFGALLVAFSVVTLVAGMPRLFGWRPLSALELSLVLAVVVGTALTPLVLAARWFRRRIWNNSVRAVALVPALRAPIVAAVSTLGTLGLAAFAVDTVAIELGAPGIATGLVGWAGWGPLVVVVGAIAAVAGALRRWVLTGTPGFARRFVGGPLVLGVAALAVAAVFQVGIAGHTAWRREATLVTSTAPKTDAAAPVLARSTPERGSVASSTSASAAPPSHASAFELEVAMGRGLAALETLAATYPEDPPVLTALVLARAKVPGQELRVLETLDRLFSADPGRAGKKELSDMVLRIALARGDASAPALDLMARRMGAPGLDMLFDLYVTSNELRVAARERLDHPEVRAKMSRALAMTYALRIAKTCEERLPLLKDAVAAGDERTVAVLRGLAARSKRGCGWKKTQPCPAQCPAEAARFDKAATDIQLRLNAAAQARGK